MTNTHRIADHQQRSDIISTSASFYKESAGLAGSGLSVLLPVLPPEKSAVPQARFPCFFHTTKCIRFAFLDGEDPCTGRDYSHRRLWMTEHLSLLLKVFCVDVVGLKIESDRYHLILSPDQRKALTLSNHEVISRWRLLYKGPKAIDSYVAGHVLTRAQHDEVAITANQWRTYLTNTSRFLGHLHQTIARKANEEDGCKGRFWEGRPTFKLIKCQASLDKVLIDLDTDT